MAAADRLEAVWAAGLAGGEISGLESSINSEESVDRSESTRLLVRVRAVPVPVRLRVSMAAAHMPTSICMFSCMCSLFDSNQK